MKKIVFISGSRADKGHLKILIKECENSGLFEVSIYDCKISSCMNMSEIFTKVSFNFLKFLKLNKFDMVIIFADRVEQLAAAVISISENILTVQIQAGDISGTIDESYRHAITKLCHAHFVSNEKSKKRVIQMGEREEYIYKIGTPSIDTLLSIDISNIKEIKNKYNVNFDNYGILIFHPVFTEIEDIESQIKNIIESIVESNLNYIIIHPNKDDGNEIILSEYKKLNNSKFKIFSTIKFEDFLIFLCHSKFIIGNSSSGIIEAPYYKIPTINIGTRQQGRTENEDIINCSYEKTEILKVIDKMKYCEISNNRYFGEGCSGKFFLKILSSDEIWNINKQKEFIGIN